MGLSNERKKRLRALFKDEVGDHLRRLSSLLLSLEKGLSEDEEKTTIEEVFRSFHTIKGSAKVINVPVIQVIAHNLEDLFSDIRRGKRKIAEGHVDVSFAALDVIMACLELDLEMTEEDPSVTRIMERIREVVGAGALPASSAPPLTAGSVPLVTPPGVPVPSALDVVIADEPPRGLDPVPSPASADRPAPGPDRFPQIGDWGPIPEGGGLSLFGTPAVPAPRQDGGPAVTSDITSATTGRPSDPPPAPGTPGAAMLPRNTMIIDGPEAIAGILEGRDAPPPVRPAAPEPPPAEHTASTRLAPRPVPAAGTNRDPKERAVSRAKDGQVSRSAYETIRVTTEKLDSLMNKVGELVISKIKADQRHKDVRDLSQIVAASMGASKMLRSVFAAFQNHSGHGLLVEKNNEMEELLKNLERKVTILQREFSNDVARMSLISRDLEDDIRSLRLLPISDLIDPFFRMVRDLAKDLGKKAVLRVEGADTEVDKKVLEGLRDPLMHILRNALDHGIESVEERRRIGKPTEGTIWIRTYQRGMSIQMEIVDDGRGIDEEKIRRTLVKRGYATEDRVTGYTSEQLLSMLFEPGFTTTDQVTEVSGRGVGLDVVRENLSSFNGSIEITSTLGQGTIFHLTLPLTLITTQALLVRCGKQTLAIPSIAVEKTLEIALADVRRVDSRQVIMLEGKPVICISLAQVLDLRHATVQSSGRTHVVVLADGTRRVALQTDEIEGEQEVVHKSLGVNFVKVRNVAGATILGTGKVVIMLNPQDLVRNSLGVHRISMEIAHVQDRQAKLLVVDDSFATRTYEQEILEAAGFLVITAPDGLAALDILAGETVDAVITDIEMPRLDGLRLTRRIKSDSHTQSIPVVIVSSLSSDDARQKGIEVGADAYVVKGEFERDSFLDILKSLVAG